MAQIGLPSTLPSLPSGLSDRIPQRGTLEGLARDTVEDALRAPGRLTDLVRGSRGALQTDPDGWPVVKGELVAVDLPQDARDQALAAGFIVLREERLDALDLSIVVLAPPRRLTLDRAVRRLREMAPRSKSLEKKSNTAP